LLFPFWGKGTVKRPSNIFLALILAATVCIAGCGGGGGCTTDSGIITPGGGSGDDTPFPSKTLSWAPPTAYTDSTPLNPSSDLDVFEIYIRTNGGFSGSDSPMAALQAVAPGTGQLTTSFDLANLVPFLSRSVPYFVSVRAVAKNGLKSDFSTPASFSF
jgi:hypothetical protein